MLRSLLSGLVLAVCVAAALLIGGGSELEHVALLGAGLGAVVGLVPNASPLGKLGGFALGFIAAWIAFGIRALLLPDTTAGRAVAAFLVILVCGAVAAVSAGRVPLWSTLMGAVAIVGAYETSYTNAPSQFLSTSPQAATTVLLAAGFGFIGSTIITTFLKGPATVGAVSTPVPYSVSALPAATSTHDPYSVSVGLEKTSIPDPYSLPELPEAGFMPDQYSLPDLPEATFTQDPYSLPDLPEATSTPDQDSVFAGPQDTSTPDPYSLPDLPEATSPPDPHPVPTGMQDTLRTS